MGSVLGLSWVCAERGCRGVGGAACAPSVALVGGLEAKRPASGGWLGGSVLLWATRGCGESPVGAPFWRRAYAVIKWLSRHVEDNKHFQTMLRC